MNARPQSKAQLAPVGRAVVEELRHFLLGLVGEEPAFPVPRSLDELARSVALGLERSQRDAVQELIASLLEATRRGTAASIHRLLEKDDDALWFAIRQRLRQSTIEQEERWNLLRQVRSHVRSALARPLAPQASWPGDLTENGRLAAAHIQQAVAAAVAEGAAPSGDAKAIASVLMNRYFPRDLPLGATREEDESASTDSPEDHLRRAIDSPIVERAIREELGPDLLRILCARLGDATLAEIAAAERIAIGTVHKRLAEVMKRLGAVSSRLGLTYGVGMAALLRLLRAPEAREKP